MSTSGNDEKQTLSAADFFFANYPFTTDGCGGDTQSCPGGDGCKCLGCTIPGPRRPQPVFVDQIQNDVKPYHKMNSLQRPAISSAGLGHVTNEEMHAMTPDMTSIQAPRVTHSHSEHTMTSSVSRLNDMDHPKTALTPPLLPQNVSQKVRNSALPWESLREEIRKFYIKQDNTLAATMQYIKAQHGLEASERKWKMQLKEWGFEKYVPASQMRIVVAKAEKRARDEGKETIFFNGENQIAPEKIETFKKRKTIREAPPASPSAETPSNITYHTPYPLPDTPRPNNLDAAIDARPDSGLEPIEHAKLPGEERTLLHPNDCSSSASEKRHAVSIGENALIPQKSTTSGEDCPHSHQFLHVIAARDSSESDSSGRESSEESSPSEVVRTIVSTMRIRCLRGYIRGITRLPSTGQVNIIKSVFRRSLELLARDAPIIRTLKSRAKSLTTGVGLMNFSLPERVARRVLLSTYLNQKLRHDDAVEYCTGTLTRLYDAAKPRWLSGNDNQRLKNYPEVLDKPQETEFRYREAMEVIDLQLDFEDALGCRTCVVEFLSLNSREEEALNLLLHSFTDYLPTHKSISSFDPFSTLVFKETLVEKLASKAFLQMLRLLQILHAKMAQDGCLIGAICVISRLQEATERLRSSVNLRYLDFDRIHFMTDVMRLGLEYLKSSVSRTHIILKFVIQELQLRVHEGNILKRDGLLEIEKYAQHCRESNNKEGLEIASSYLAAAALVKNAALEAEEDELINQLFGPED